MAGFSPLSGRFHHHRIARDIFIRVTRTDREAPSHMNMDGFGMIRLMPEPIVPLNARTRI